MEFFNLFHSYGLIVGLAVGVGWWLVEKQAQANGVTSTQIWRVIWPVVIGGLLGARFWHVFTDWQLYSERWWQVFYVWQGGLSIFGAILGGALGLRLAVGPGQKFWRWLDWIALALPFGQALGRLANYFNQELYGLPSNLPWAVHISIQRRLPGFEQFETYHPLFFYEAIMLLLFGSFLWLWQRGEFQRQFWLPGWSRFKKLLKPQVKPGTYFFTYLAFYSLLRVGLDFFRLGVDHVLWGMGINQLIMVAVFLAVVGFWFGQYWSRGLLVFWILMVILGGVAGFKSEKALSSRLSRAIQDHSIQRLQIGDSELQVEVVNSPSSIAQGLSGRPEIGADGMLFLMPARGEVQFWMPDMQFDLDLVWIDRGQIVGITRNVPRPPPGTSKLDLPLYPSPTAVEWVLEVEAGFAEANGWQIGDMIKL